MGGYGSGRTCHKQKAEECKSLDVNQLHRAKCLLAGTMGHWVWSRGSEEVGRIDFRMDEGALALNYNIRFNGGDWQSIAQTIPITYADCHYGGARPYFLCGGVVNGRHCGRRVGKLFAGGRYFLCRHCYRIAYRSQSEAKYDRLLRRANKLRIALGGEAGQASWIAPKPKGMWTRTYDQKRLEIEWCENKAVELFVAKFERLRGEIEAMRLLSLL